MIDRFNAIRKRRAAFDRDMNDSRTHGDMHPILDGMSDFYFHAPADIDWLLGYVEYLDYECGAAMNDARQTDEECQRLLAEVERLRAELNKIYWLQTCHKEGFDETNCPSCLAQEVLGDALIEYVDTDTLNHEDDSTRGDT